MNTDKHLSRGKFISFEGIDRCGKTTQARLLKRSLDRINNTSCLLTAEPGGSGELGVALRDVILNPLYKREEITAAMLFSAERHEHVVKIINPALQSGRWVICDRYIDSTIAYQGGGGGVSVEILDQLVKISTMGVRPDLTILLELDTSKRSKRNPKLDYYDRGSEEYDKRIKATFDRLTHEEPNRFLVIDGDQEIKTIAKQILSVISRRFPPNP